MFFPVLPAIKNASHFHSHPLNHIENHVVVYINSIIGCFPVFFCYHLFETLCKTQDVEVLEFEDKLVRQYIVESR